MALPPSIKPNAFLLETYGEERIAKAFDYLVGRRVILSNGTLTKLGRQKAIHAFLSEALFSMRNAERRKAEKGGSPHN